MDRYTKKDAENAFTRLCKMLNQRPAASWDDHGAWRLDYAPCYGGYTVERIDDVTSGVSHPLGDLRRPAREFCQMVWDIGRALEVYEEVFA